MGVTRLSHVFVVGALALGLFSTLLVTDSLGSPNASTRPMIGEVKNWQYCLTLMGFNPGPIDGHMGPQTGEALVAWMRVRFGPDFARVPNETRGDQLIRECAERRIEFAQNRPVAQGDPIPLQILYVQECLARLVGYDGLRDGTLGSDTTAAFTTWHQRKFGPGYATVPAATWAPVFRADCEATVNATHKR